MTRELVCRVTIKDCEVETFRVSGAGGQHRDKTSNGVRIKHPPSGAMGECREMRSQLENKRRAFRRMGESKEFQAWARAQRGEEPLPPSSSSDRIRTYNVIDSWVKDHRTNKTSHDVQRVLDGDLDSLR